jgi:ABC-type multidrug transport system fused ATPase/permease subunit
MFNEVSDEKILQTLETVGLKEKILSLNKGIHTVIVVGSSNIRILGRSNSTLQSSILLI